MNQPRFNRLRLTKQLYVAGTLLCICLFVYAAAVEGQADRVSQLVSQLRSSDLDSQCKAAEALGDLKDARAIDPLIATFKGGNSLLFSFAVEALGKIGAPAVEALIVALDSPDPFVSMHAGQALGKMGTSPVEPLIANLRSNNPVTRRNAAWALGQIGIPAAQRLISLLSDSDPYVRRGAAKALGEIGDSSAVDPLIAALKSSDSDAFRKDVAEALGKIKDPRASEFLLGALRERDTVVIAGAMEFFVARSGPDSEDLLIEALDKFGDKETAVALLNSGKSNLTAAAHQWAEAHGYRTTTVPAQINEYLKAHPRE
jgi:HEAT repeat protein